jgi:prepilin-type N-terminal cleavage/methylation domain-containing protein
MRRRGFTLIELLVVVGIIAALIGILIPTINKSRASGRKMAMQSQLNSIAAAVTAYRADFGDYPRPEFADTFANIADRPNPASGAEILCRALVGPFPAVDATVSSGQLPSQDGADGPGFRFRAQGKVWGPYMPADKIKIKNSDGTANLNGSATLVDANDVPIVYIPKTRWRSDIRAGNGFVAKNDLDPATTGDNAVFPVYNQQDARKSFNVLAFRHSDETTDANGIIRLRAMLGDMDNNGHINGTETPTTEGAFILWAAGDDNEFGPNMADPMAPTAEEIRRCDDAIHFQD